MWFDWFVTAYIIDIDMVTVRTINSLLITVIYSVNADRLKLSVLVESYSKKKLFRIQIILALE